MLRAHFLAVHNLQQVSHIAPRLSQGGCGPADPLSIMAAGGLDVNGR